MLIGTPYHFARRDDYYLVGSLDPSSPLFPHLARTDYFEVNYLPPVTAAHMLSSYGAQISHTPESNLLVVTASEDTMRDIEARLKYLDTGGSNQITYRFDVVELKESQSSSLGLEELSLQLENSKNAPFEFIHREDLLRLMQGIPPSILSIDSLLEQSNQLQLSSPTLVTTLNNRAVISLLEEATSLLKDSGNHETRRQGLKLSITPERIDNKNRVLSEIALDTSSEIRDLETKIWVEEGNHQLVGILRQQISSQKSELLYRKSRTEERFFALYVTAYPGSRNPGEDSLSTASMDGLGNLLWKREEPLLENYFMTTSELGSDKLQSIAAAWWFNQNNRLELSGNENHYSICLERRLEENLRLGLQVFNPREKGGYLALGFSERVEVSPRVVLSAGFWPLVYDLSERELISSYWQVKSELRGSKTLFQLDYSHEKDYSSLQTTVGYRLFEPFYLLLGYSIDREGDERLVFGTRWELWK